MVIVILWFIVMKLSSNATTSTDWHIRCGYSNDLYQWQEIAGTVFSDVDNTRDAMLFYDDNFSILLLFYISSRTSDLTSVIFHVSSTCLNSWSMISAAFFVDSNSELWKNELDIISIRRLMTTFKSYKSLFFDNPFPSLISENVAFTPFLVPFSKFTHIFSCFLCDRFALPFPYRSWQNDWQFDLKLFAVYKLS